MNREEKRIQFEQEFKEKGKQLHNNKYDYSNVVYVNSRTKVKIICPKHGVFEQKVKDGKYFYNVAIDVWTVRDVKKRQVAIDNHLNYVVFWKNDLSDFKEWLNADELVLNNIL